MGAKRESISLTPARIRGYDCVVVATAHGGFDFTAILRHARGIVDTRNAFKGRRSAKITRL
jgi:UDP-N-acetyl-D-mannosaminuronate dehydrogenase